MTSEKQPDNDRDPQDSCERSSDASGNGAEFDQSNSESGSSDRHAIERSTEEPTPFELEEPERHDAPSSQEPAGASSHDPGKEPETCPNCMAPMHERGAMVCLRCGFDQRSLRIAKTRVAKDVQADDDSREDEEEEERAERSTPLSRQGLGGVQLPIAVAAVSGLILLIGILAGWPGLFPSWVVREAGGDPISLLERATNVGRFLVLIALWTGCAIGGLYLLALTLQRPMGDLRLAAARMLGIIVAIRLVTFIHVPGPAWVEWMLETVLQFGLFIGLGLAFFRLQPRDALTLGGWALLLVLVMWLFAHAVVWVH